MGLGAGRFSFLVHTLLSDKRAKQVEVVDERRKTSQWSKVRAAFVSCEIVDLGDVGNEVAFVRLFQEKVVCNRFRAQQAHTIEGLFRRPISSCANDVSSLSTAIASFVEIST